MEILNSRQVSILLIAGSALSFLVPMYQDFEYFGEYAKREAGGIITAIAFLILGGSYFNFIDLPRKTIGILIAAAAGIWLIQGFLQVIDNPLGEMLIFLVGLLFPVAILVFGILLAVNKNARIRLASKWLMIGAAIPFSFLTYKMTMAFVDLINGYRDVTIDTIGWLLRKELYIFLQMLFPIALIVLAERMLNTEDPVSFTHTAVDYAPDSQQPSRFDWLTIVLLGSIPVAGIVLSIIWAKDPHKRIRGSWAMANLFWISLISLFFFVILIMNESLLCILVLAVLPVTIYFMVKINKEVYKGYTSSLKRSADFILDDVHGSMQENVTDRFSIGKWILNIFLLRLPLAGLIIAIVWANDESNKIRKEWAAGNLFSLIFSAVLTGFYVLYENLSY